MNGTIDNGTIAGGGPAPGAQAVAVLDAAGVIGRGLVAAAQEAGHPVVAVDRDLSALAAISAQWSRDALVAVPGSAHSDGEARQLARALRGLEMPLAAVLVAVDAGRLRGRLLDQPVDTICEALQASLAPQLAAARHLLPLLADSGQGSFVMIGGPGGRHPWAGYGQRSVTEAALRMLARVLHDEARAFDVRVRLLSVDMPTCGLHGGPPRAHWPSALQIGQHAIRLLEAGGQDAIVEFPSPVAHDAGQPGRQAPARQERPAWQPASAAAQAADSAGALLPSGCLQDARTLLRALAPEDRGGDSRGTGGPQHPARHRKSHAQNKTYN